MACNGEVIRPAVQDAVQSGLLLSRGARHRVRTAAVAARARYLDDGLFPARIRRARRPPVTAAHRRAPKCDCRANCPCLVRAGTRRGCHSEVRRTQAHRRKLARRRTATQRDRVSRARRCFSAPARKTTPGYDLSSRGRHSVRQQRTRCAYRSTLIHITFGSVKLSMAASPCSRPKPESRAPPQGSRTSVGPKVLIQTVPAFSRRPRRCTRPIFAVHTPAARL